MTGWNLPPGVNVGDIPGNRPIDIAVDKLFDALCAFYDADGDTEFLMQLWADATTERKAFWDHISDEYDREVELPNDVEEADHIRESCTPFPEE